MRLFSTHNVHTYSDTDSFAVRQTYVKSPSGYNVNQITIAGRGVCKAGSSAF